MFGYIEHKHTNNTLQHTYRHTHTDRRTHAHVRTHANVRTHAQRGRYFADRYKDISPPLSLAKYTFIKQEMTGSERYLR